MKWNTINASFHAASLDCERSKKKFIMTSSTHQRRISQDELTNPYVTCRCESRHKTSQACHKRLMQTNRDILRMQIEKSDIMTSSKVRFEERKKKKRLEAQDFSTLYHFCTNIFPKISLWKILLAMHLFILLIQINRCESSAKWWWVLSISFLFRFYFCATIHKCTCFCG